MKGRSDAGNATIEFAIGVVVIIGFVAVILALGRSVSADGATAQAAREAARAATLQRDATQARQAAQQTAYQVLEGQEIDCASRSVSADLSGFTVPEGATGAVTVTVECVVDLDGDLWPWDMAYAATGQATSVLDTYRGRST